MSESEVTIRAPGLLAPGLKGMGVDKVSAIVGLHTLYL
jgi:hypothetical protein